MHAPRLIITDYHSRQSDIRRVRDEVFLNEQQINRDDEIDDRDTKCVHVLAVDDERPVGTGRIDLEKEGKIGRVAVLRQYRRNGIGTLIMAGLLDEAKRSGLQRVWFHAQKSAVPFYLALGYVIIGEEFEEAGIPHVSMELRLIS